MSTYAYQWFRCQGAMLNVSISWSSLMTMEFCPEGGRKWGKQMLHDDNNYVYITKGYDVQVDKVFRCLSCKLGWFDQLRRWVLNVTPPTTSDQHSLWELAIKIAYESMGNVSTEWNIVYWDCPDTWTYVNSAVCWNSVNQRGIFVWTCQIPWDISEYPIHLYKI